jgi:hypothetical protein
MFRVVDMSRCEAKKSGIARADNRANFPATARLLDEFKKEFGDDQVKLIFAEEGGKTIGKKLPEPVNYLTADQWLKMSEKLSFEGMKK